MWKRLGFGDATITNEPTIDYDKTSSSFPHTPTTRRTASCGRQNSESRLSDDLSTPTGLRDTWDNDDDDYDQEFSRYRFDYTRNLDYDTYGLDGDLQRDADMIREWTKESNSRSRLLQTDGFDDTHFSLPSRFPGKYQVADHVYSSRNDEHRLDQESQVDCEIKKLKKELQKDQQSEEDLMPGPSIVPRVTEVTTVVQNQSKYLSQLKQLAELADEQDTDTATKYQALKHEYLHELKKVESLYTCYYNLLEKYLELNAKAKGGAK
ncbi:hypothetical protein KGF57_000595 [Candida theae]|uniref:Uncharacterized protein n=1 Tax=Candida theae TaxID=1198502 RepID=A0AAD5G0I5_9ASCO|nr:uncharacterized protein KGF57_000595 [Candida theae]KAI5966631.1 hypothetical protein KGF57_000595 [Candida theae]